MNGFEDHNHGACVAEGLALAEARCAQDGLRLTPMRRRVLEILLEGHRAMGAYDILGRLAAEGHGAQPPVAYRALDFLVKAGLAHRIEASSGYVACMHPGQEHEPIFLVCTSCDAVAESAASRDLGPLGAAARTAGFKIEGRVQEARGLCPSCLTAPPAPSGASTS